MASGASRILLHPFGGEPTAESEPRGPLGPKDAAWRELADAGLAVPPGFSLGPETASPLLVRDRRWPVGWEAPVREAVAGLERLTGRRLGDPRQPLLLAVRGPGDGGTLLNIGLNDKTVLGLARICGREAAAWHGYRRFLESFGVAALGAEPAWFAAEQERVLGKYKARHPRELRADQVQEIVEGYQKNVLPRGASPMRYDAFEQIRLALAAVAQAAREGGSAPRGLCLHVQAMALGNLGPESGVGRAFSRDPVSGEARLAGLYALDSQELEEPGAPPPRPLEEMAREEAPTWRAAHAALREGLGRLEERLRHPQETDFVVERGRLWFLHTRPARRAPLAGLRWAVELAGDRESSSRPTGWRRWTPREALATLTPADLRAPPEDAPPPPRGAGRRRAPLLPRQRLLRQVSDWSDALRTLEVLAAAHSPAEVKAACEDGADGVIALRLPCLAEPDSLWVLREAMFESRGEAREQRLARLAPRLRQEFDALLAATLQRPLHVVLPDPGALPLLPSHEKEWRELARRVDRPLARVQAALRAGQGRRGTRAILALPELARLVARVGRESAAALESRLAVRPRPAWWIPGATGAPDFERVRALLEESPGGRPLRTRVAWECGALIQTPRAALLADQLAAGARHLCFDLHALQRALLGLDRAEAADPAALRAWQEPGRAFDMAGLGALLQGAVRQARQARPDAHFGAVGLDAEDAALLRALTRLGLAFVGGAPDRTFGARLAAAQATPRATALSPGA
jgi:phosphoenolpyruvate synthase/pyruvate phosphate dikinase